MNPSAKTATIAALTSLSVALMGYFFLPCKKTDADIASQNTAYEEIRNRKTIKAAYVVGAPLFMIDPNTNEKSGIFFELVETAASKLALKVKWTEEVGYGEMIEGLARGRYDIMGSGVWLNGARGASADYSIPVYYDAVLAYSRDDDRRFDKDLGILNSQQYTISTQDGELGATIAETDFPLASTVELPQAADFTQMALNVYNKKADVVFLALAPARKYQQANPGHIRLISSRPLRIFPLVVLLPKGEYGLKTALDAALIEMLTNGEVERILRKYEPHRGSFLRTAAPYERTDQP